MRLRVALFAVTLAALIAPAGAAAQSPLGLTCQPQNGVRFCTGAKVASFDGTLLDVDVTLPPSGAGPFPGLAMLHGYGGDKTSWERDNAEARDAEGTIHSQTYHWNNVHFAQRGYAVINYAARGFGESEDHVHLKDQRVEAHDTQHLLGRLVDEGIARPDALGVTGVSYGGGESIQLAYLRDRVRNADGTFSPWVSPEKKVPLRIAAAYPRWPWSDLVSALLPNGRFLDFDPATNDDGGKPVGVMKQSYIAGLYALGQTTGTYAPPGTDPRADLTTWVARVNAGEPYDDPAATAFVDELRQFHSGFGLLPATPAPMLLQIGWTDDLFPPIEALRIYNAARAADPNAPVALQIGDLGHQRGGNKLAPDQYLNDQGTAFLDAYLQKDGPLRPPLAPGTVTAFTQTCPADAPSGGPFTAPSWAALHPGAVRFGKAEAQSVSSAGGDPSAGTAIDPVQAGQDPCVQVDAQDAPGTAVVTGEKVTAPFTLMGLPTVSAKIATTGPFGQLAGRLWDVAPDGKQTLVSRGVYRLTDNQQGTITFQLSGNGWRFEAGHTPRLELLGRDAPYFRPSNGQFSVAVSEVNVELPTLEGPGGAVGQRVLSAGDRENLASCVARSSAARARARPRGRGLRFALPAGSGRVRVDVFQQSAGRRVLRARRVARFAARRASFTWSGRRGTDGVYVVRFRGPGDERRVVLLRRGGRFRARPDYALRSACGPLALFKLERPAFTRSLGIAYRLGISGRVSVRVLRGRRVVRRFAPRSVRQNRLVRLRLRGVRRGEVRVRIAVTAAGRTVTRTLVARRV